MCLLSKALEEFRINNNKEMKIKVKKTRMEHKIDKKVLKNRERKRISNNKTIKALFNKS